MAEEHKMHAGKSANTRPTCGPAEFKKEGDGGSVE